jgi:hypothetical protein
VQRERGEPEAAVRTLEEAAKVAPQWTLAQLRGNVLDELGRKDDAVTAYDEALALPGVWAGSVRYNRAVASRRSAAGVKRSPTPRSRSRTRAMRLRAARAPARDRCARRARRHDDAIALVHHVGGMDEVAAALTADLRACALARAGRLDAAREAGRARGGERHGGNRVGPGARARSGLGPAAARADASCAAPRVRRGSADSFVSGSCARKTSGKHSGSWPASSQQDELERCKKLPDC